ncbi:RIP metalloprotease RseP [Acuticoccus sp. MNP-M23]|uniref:RIP metalloprotease RseP n=1 Tax=Acuticoccus sp. MNP-M23 TaxID=3072793 RepID=UPI0028152020|nr:RIP metalloprotease RseP [Acuticoccus sp. MNP-M23]WMS41184.1 RIP metalloprotease RseP [Acuticoccus sp. MNP-M23]
MDYILSLGSNVASYALPFLFVLGLIIFVHEMGHFLVARWCGVAVDAFSIGFGPELFGWNDRYNTRWKLSVVPLGGYVKFAGDENAASVPDRDALSGMSEAERKTSFFLKPLWQRAAIVAAGPVANFILAIAIFAIYFSINGRPMADAMVSSVQPDSPAAAAGFEPGDVIVAIDGDKVASFSAVQRVVASAAGETLTFTVTRGGESVDLVATPEQRELTDPFGNPYAQGVLGVQRDVGAEGIPREKLGPFSAIAAGVDETLYITKRTVEVVGGIITGTQSANQLGGPLRVAQVSGEVASISFSALFSLAAMLSVSIGLINLMPIPMLDGGHLLFYAIEGLRGRPLSERAQDVGFRIGLGLVLLLMGFATFNDIVHLTS